MRTLEQCIAEFGDGSRDGMIRKLINADFASLGGHHGGGRWKIVNERVTFVDDWGGAWAETLPGEVSAKEAIAKNLAAGGVSQTALVETAARFSR